MKLSLRAISALCAVTVCSNDATRASIAANRANRLSMSTDATVRPIARLHPPHTYITRPPQLVDPAIQLRGLEHLFGEPGQQPTGPDQTHPLTVGPGQQLRGQLLHRARARRSTPRAHRLPNVDRVGHYLAFPAGHQPSLSQVVTPLSLRTPTGSLQRPGSSPSDADRPRSDHAIRRCCQ